MRETGPRRSRFFTMCIDGRPPSLLRRAPRCRLRTSRRRATPLTCAFGNGLEGRLAEGGSLSRRRPRIGYISAKKRNRGAGNRAVARPPVPYKFRGGMSHAFGGALGGWRKGVPHVPGRALGASGGGTARLTVRDGAGEGRATAGPGDGRGGASHALGLAMPHVLGETQGIGEEARRMRWIRHVARAQRDRGARREGCAARVCRDRRRERVARVGVGASHALGGGQKWRDASRPGRSIPKPRRFFRKPSGDRAARAFGGMKKRPEDSGRFDMRLCELAVTRTRSCRRAWG